MGIGLHIKSRWRTCVQQSTPASHTNRLTSERHLLVGDLFNRVSTITDNETHNHRNRWTLRQSAADFRRERQRSQGPSMRVQKGSGSVVSRQKQRWHGSESGVAFGLSLPFPGKATEAGREEAGRETAEAAGGATGTAGAAGAVWAVGATFWQVRKRAAWEDLVEVDSTADFFCFCTKGEG